MMQLCENNMFLFVVLYILDEDICIASGYVFYYHLFYADILSK